MKSECSPVGFWFGKVLAMLVVFAIALSGKAQETAGAGPVNDFFSNATVLQGSTVDFGASLTNATFEAGEPHYDFYWPAPQGGSVWWTWTAPLTGFAAIRFQTLDRSPAFYPAVFSVYQGSSMDQFTNENRVAMVDLIPHFKIAFPVTGGRAYRFALVGDASTNLLFSFHLDASAGPIIQEEPSDLTARAGGSAWFTVMSTVSPFALTRWQFNGADLMVPALDSLGTSTNVAATGPTVSVNNLTTNSGGEFRAIVQAMNNAGQLVATTSRVARLTIEGQDINPTLQIARMSGTNKFRFTVLGETNQTYQLLGSFDFARWHGVFTQNRFLQHGIGTNAMDLEFDPFSFFKAERFGDLRSRCIANLHRIDMAKRMWASIRLKMAGTVPEYEEVNHYLGGLSPICAAGGVYNYGVVGAAPTCSIEGHSL
jgi:hypothetical protein